MRAVCDVCESAPARVFCAADQAAMCAACDEKIHSCNKLAMTHVRVELGESAPTPRCEECAESPAFFFTPEDGLSLCLQCDLNVHPTTGPQWDRYMIYEQRVWLQKNVVDGRCGGCAGKCNQCRERIDEAQSHAAHQASPCGTPTQAPPTGRSSSSDFSCNVPPPGQRAESREGVEVNTLKPATGKKRDRLECDDASSNSGEDEAGDARRVKNNKITPVKGISEVQPALVVFRSSD